MCTENQHKYRPQASPEHLVLPRLCILGGNTIFVRQRTEALFAAQPPDLEFGAAAVTELRLFANSSQGADNFRHLTWCNAPSHKDLIDVEHWS
jgi:hypothetical protein